MTKTDAQINNLSNMLMETRHGKNDGDVDKLEDVIWDIVDIGNPRDIICLCDAFEDYTPHADMTGPMQSLINGIHEYNLRNSPTTVAPYAVEGLIRMVPQAEEWATQLLSYYINEGDSFLKEIAIYCRDRPNHIRVIMYLLDKAYTSYGIAEQVDKLRQLLSTSAT